MAFPRDQYRRDIHGRGRKAVFVRASSEAVDDGAPWDGSAVISDDADRFQTMIMKFKSVSKSDVNGDSVLSTDQVVQIFAPDLAGDVPAVGDMIEDGADTLRIKRVTTKAQGTEVFRFDLHVGF